MENGPAHRRAAQLGLEVIDGGRANIPVETRRAATPRARSPIIRTDRLPIEHPPRHYTDQPQPSGRLPDRIVYERPERRWSDKPPSAD